MISELVDMSKRNILIVELIKDILKDPQRKILVLSDRRNHLVKIKELLDNDNSITFTYGLFLGSMKQKDLELSRACNVILATISCFGEGVSEKELDSMILCSPKKYIGHIQNNNGKKESFKIEQIVGRIFRKNHIERHPIIIDLQDQFSVYKTQAKSRVIFYKQHFKNAIFEDQSINLDECEDEFIKQIQNNKIKKVSENILCMLDD
jgi:hypothetical protein